jgi:hypothetical protein
MGAVAPTSDFISDFFQATPGVISPEIFRTWSGISLLAGALERRVWVRTGNMTTFLNMYVLLVAPPGVGKKVIQDVRDLWLATNEPGGKTCVFKVAPHSMTKAALIDVLARSKTVRTIANGVKAYNSLLVAAGEFPVLLPSYDPEYIATLNDIYDNPPSHDEERRHGPAQKVYIENPQLNILGGVQPSFLANSFPDHAWSTGFSRRFIMIFSAETPEHDLLDLAPIPEVLKTSLLSRLVKLSQLWGELNYEPEAFEFLRKWHSGGRKPKPTHSKLEHYERNRTQNVIKLSGLSALSRGALPGPTAITIGDVKRAIAWLVEAEELMPDIFRAMIGKSDGQVIEELGYFVQGYWSSKKQKPLEEKLLWEFLIDRVPSEKIPKIMEAALRSNVIARVVGTEDLYIPRPKYMQVKE